MSGGAGISRALRAATPAIVHGESRGWCYLDGPGGTQMMSAAIETMAGHARAGLSNRHGYSPAGDETEDLIGRARAQVREMFGGAGYEVVFGQNMTSLSFALAHALARRRGREGARVISTELEHFANVDPWSQTFRERGGSISWIRVGEESLSFRAEDMAEYASAPHLAVVAATAAANSVGRRPDLSALRDLAHERGAIFVVDAVHAVPHCPPDLRELRADILLCSAYKFYGPHVGIALIREDLCEDLPAFKVAPAPAHGPGKIETGTQNHEGIAALVGTIDGLAHLVGGSGGAAARAALRQLGEYELDLAQTLVSRL